MLDYIETNYKHDISLCDFAERFHLNAEYVSRLLNHFLVLISKHILPITV